MAQTRESLRRGLATNYGLLGRTWCRYIAAVGSVNLAGWPWCRWLRAVNAIEADRLQRQAGVAIAAQKACASSEGRGGGCSACTERVRVAEAGQVLLERLAAVVEQSRCRKWGGARRSGGGKSRREGQHAEEIPLSTLLQGGHWGEMSRAVVGSRVPSKYKGIYRPGAAGCWLRGGEHRQPSSMTSIRPAGQAHGP
jgi:hypothetical protein